MRSSSQIEEHWAKTYDPIYQNILTRSVFEDSDGPQLKRSKTVRQSLSDYIYPGSQQKFAPLNEIGEITNELSTEQVRSLAVTTAFPLFIQSLECQEWLKNEKRMEDKSYPTEKACDFPPPDEETLTKTKASIKDATSHLEHAYFDFFVGDHKDWASVLMQEMENLPLCVSIAIAREDQPGFPLIYVNKSFERMTGYTRQECLGQNCRFLQSEETELSQIALMSAALKAAKPVNVALTNRRKDGSDFKNCLAMQPVFDDNNEYAFVFGCQYALSDAPITDREMDIDLVTDLLAALPYLISTITGSAKGFNRYCDDSDSEKTSIPSRSRFAHTKKRTMEILPDSRQRHIKYDAK
jgi:PAS domain S-box-containing protein